MLVTLKLKKLFKPNTKNEYSIFNIIDNLKFQYYFLSFQNTFFIINNMSHNNFFMKNNGFSKTIVVNNEKTNVQNIDWNTHFDGDLANINLNVQDNDKIKHYDIQLTNDEIKHIFNQPSHNDSIHNRLLNDFNTIHHQPKIKHKHKHIKKVRFDLPSTCNKHKYTIKKKKLKKLLKTLRKHRLPHNSRTRKTHYSTSKSKSKSNSKCKHNRSTRKRKPLSHSIIPKSSIRI